MAYGQVLLDLIKGFERIPHAILAREATRLGYPLWLLRLSLAAYRLPRSLRIDGVRAEGPRQGRGPPPLK